MGRQGLPRARRWRHIGHRGGIAVIGRLGDDEAGAAGRHLRDPQRKIIGLAAGAGQNEMTDLRGERREQPLRIAIDDIVQITGVGVELDRPAAGSPRRQRGCECPTDGTLL